MDLYFHWIINPIHNLNNSLTYTCALCITTRSVHWEIKHMDKDTTPLTLAFLFLSPPNSKCLHLLMASILLDLQLGSTHSSLNTIFFVVLACTESRLVNTPLLLQHHTCLVKLNQGFFFLNLPSCGRWASSDHRTHSAFCRISSYLQHTCTWAAFHNKEGFSTHEPLVTRCLPCA